MGMGIVVISEQFVVKVGSSVSRDDIQLIPDLFRSCVHQITVLGDEQLLVRLTQGPAIVVPVGSTIRLRPRNGCPRSVPIRSAQANQTVLTWAFEIAR